MATESLHNNPSKPDYWHPYYREIEPTLEYLKDMYEGRRRWIGDDWTIVDSEKALRYLPKAKSQDNASYLEQLSQSVFVRFFRDAIEKDIASLLTDFDLTESADWFEDFTDNVDLLGNDLKSFIKQWVCMAVRDGSSFVLVDRPNLEQPPYFLLLERSQIINWRFDGSELDLVVYKQDELKPDGDFGLSEWETYTVLRRGGDYQIYERQKRKSFQINTRADEILNVDLKLVREGRYGLQEIPLIGLSLNSHTPFTATPPLVDFADLNLAHYQVWSGYRTTINYLEPTLLAKEQQPFAADEPSQQKALTVGARVTLWNLDAGWMEPTGTGVLPKKDCLALLETTMQKMVVSFFSGGATKTATEVELDAAQSEATLSGYAVQLESAVQSLFSIFAEYEGLMLEDAGAIAVNKSLLKTTTQMTLEQLNNSVAMGQMSLPFMYEILYRSDSLPKGISWEMVEDELERLGQIDDGERTTEPGEISDDDSTDERTTITGDRQRDGTGYEDSGES
jgi:hypothetical protein